MNPFKYDTTEDIQHDLALELASPLFPGMRNEMIEELTRRKEKLPINCKYEYCPYSRFKKKLSYELK